MMLLIQLACPMIPTSFLPLLERRLHHVSNGVRDLDINRQFQAKPHGTE